MPTNKNAVIRHKILDKCFRNPGRKYYWQDLAEECEKALTEEGLPDPSVSRTTIYNDIRFMQSSTGYNAPIEAIRDEVNPNKKYYRYSDLNFSVHQSPLSEADLNQIESVLDILSKVKGIPQFEWLEEVRLRLLSDTQAIQETLLSFESNPYLTGLEFLYPLFNHIVYKNALEIQYQDFRSDEPYWITIYPYHLKQWNKRWFLFGNNPDSDAEVWTMALDRIKDIKDSDNDYLGNSSIDFDEYFNDIIGITQLKDVNVEEIVLEVKETLVPYLQTKPIHETQRLIKKVDDKWITKIQVRPNYELYSQLLSYGEGLVVQSPASVRGEMKRKIEGMRGNYG